MNRKPIKDAISTSALDIHECQVEKVYPSGLVDLRVFTGGTLSQINLIIIGAEGLPQVGDECVVLSDGAKHFYLGTTNPVQLDSEGNPSVRNRRSDLSSFDDAKEICVYDDFGNFSRMAVSKGGGAVVDSGMSCVTHWHPGMSKIINYSRQLETISDPMYFCAEQDGESCTTKYKWRTTLDHESIDRDYNYEDDPEKDIGNTVSMEVSPGENLIEVTTRKDGDKKITIIAKEDGTVTLENNDGANVVTMNSDGGIEITSKGVDGYIAIGNGPVELLGQIDQLLQQLLQTQVMTSMGPQPLLTVPSIAGIRTALQEIKKP